MKINVYALRVIVLFSIGLLISFISFSAFNTEKTDRPSADKMVDTNIEDVAKHVPEFRYGIDINLFDIEDNKVKRNEFLSTILSRYDIDPVTIANIVDKSKPVFNVRTIAAGKPYTVFTEKKDNKIAYFIYEPNPAEYIVYDLRDSILITAYQKESETRIEDVGGTINSSLYGTLSENGGDPDLAVHLSKIFGGVINFYSIKEGDWFKIRYERQYVEDEPYGSSKILSAIFNHNGKEYEAHFFQPDSLSEGEYYDAEGNSLRRSFLKAPLKFSRISSRYSKRRLHPVQKVWKAHLGTDYAAPHGTPIVSTGDGVVIESGFTRGNGNYVKIKHNSTYTTQYLHMSKRAARKGQRIKQGQVIGYVGSTGLATGPHVCYRFWKNGQQVDPLRQNFKAATPISAEYKTAFSHHITQQNMEMAVISIENGVTEEPVLALYEERPSAIFKYFGNEG